MLDGILLQATISKRKCISFINKFINEDSIFNFNIKFFRIDFTVFKERISVIDESSCRKEDSEDLKIWNSKPNKFHLSIGFQKMHKNS